MVEAVVGRHQRAAHLRGLPSLSAGAGRSESAALPGVRTAAWVAVAAPQMPPRVPGLAALLGEVDRLRRDLRADLTLAATAAEAGEPALAAFLLHPTGAGQSTRLHDFEQRALTHLRRLEQDEGAMTAVPVQAAPLAPAPLPAAHLAPAPLPAAPRPAARTRRRTRRLLPATPLVAAAAALFGFLAGVGPDRVAGDPAKVNQSTRTDVVRRSLLADQNSVVSETAAALHASLLPLVARAATDPVAAAEALALLRVETDLLRGAAHPDELTVLIDQTRLLASRLLATVPALRSERSLLDAATLQPTPLLSPRRLASELSLPASPGPDAAAPEPTRTARPATARPTVARPATARPATARATLERPTAPATPPSPAPPSPMPPSPTPEPSGGPADADLPGGPADVSR